MFWLFSNFFGGNTRMPCFKTPIPFAIVETAWQGHEIKDQVNDNCFCKSLVNLGPVPVQTHPVLVVITDN